MNPYALKDLTHEERQSVFLGEAVSGEEQQYMKTLTPEELAIKREEMTNATILHDELDAEFKKLKDAHKEKVAPILLKRKESLAAIRMRAVPIIGKVWLLADHDNKMMHSVTDDGTVLGSRPMLPEERQYRISTTLNKAM
jgi:hypothetical protein